MSDTITDITWSLSWEARRLSAAVSVRDRDRVSEQVKKLKSLLDDLDKALSVPSDCSQKIYSIDRARSERDILKIKNNLPNSTSLK